MELFAIDPLYFFGIIRMHIWKMDRNRWSISRATHPSGGFFDSHQVEEHFNPE
ncbi:MAG: hypothetical protein UT23_C0004G0114 [Candidatus Woesebacteria bacterium GW2011_GWA1_39_12]|uniref:Uncharacterized protein n=1 Tax=Candidatus Woesebacteria bacterium GW2011_GWA1_39_12 TaxID=1618549 RepID=A0A0G0MD65_9BACT|nr:MAG: hypothetical protein UT23_C0004G0114 [Candidatus Woesebacteria bacterium GW2011_GWA1_39_12]